MSTDPAAQDDEIRRYESYIKADPENALLWINLGDLYHRNGRFDEAIACFEKCLTFDESNLIARGRLANVLISIHRFNEAEHVIRDILRAGGEQPALLHNLGLALFYQRKFRDAQEQFERARTRGLAATSNLAYIVYSQHKQNDTGTALDTARTWLEKCPGPATEGYVAMLEMDHGDMDAARKRAERVLTDAPDNPDAGVVMGTWCIERQEIAQAVTHFRQVVAAEPDNPRAWQGLGLAHMYEQNFPKAIESLEKSLECMPDYATNHLIIGWACLANKDAKAAEKAFRAAIDANRTFGEGHGGLATALLFQNRIDEAKQEISRARRLDRKSFGAAYASSILLQLQGNRDQGTRLFARVLEQAPVPRSQPLIEHIQTYLRKQGSASTGLKPDKSPGDSSP